MPASEEAATDTHFLDKCWQKITFINYVEINSLHFHQHQMFFASYCCSKLLQHTLNGALFVSNLWYLGPKKVRWWQRIEH